MGMLGRLLRGGGLRMLGLFNPGVFLFFGIVTPPTIVFIHIFNIREAFFCITLLLSFFGAIIKYKANKDNTKSCMLAWLGLSLTNKTNSLTIKAAYAFTRRSILGFVLFVNMLVFGNWFVFEFKSMLRTRLLLGTILFIKITFLLV